MINVNHALNSVVFGVFIHSLPRELTKTGTSKVVKPGSKNSAKSSLSRVSRTKETVTAQGASGGASNDNTVTTDDNSPRPSNTSNEQC